MADRYWVGGTGTWSNTNTANWSTGTGGSGGASVPTNTDDVYIDANSNIGTGSFTITLSDASPLSCGSLTVANLDGALTMSGTTQLNINGNFILPGANITWSYSGFITINGSTVDGLGSINHGININTNNIEIVGGTISFLSNLNIQSNTFTVSAGTINLNTRTLSAGTFITSGTSAKTINLNSGTLSLWNDFNIVAGTNCTVNAGTSTINLTGVGGTLVQNFTGDSQTYWNVAFTNALSTQATTGRNIRGTNTFNNLSFTAPSTAGLSVFNFFANQTINGSLNCTGVNGNRRVFLISDTFGTTRTLTCAASSLTDTDFRDITVTGAGSPLSGTRIGDCGGNSGITFTPAKNVWWSLNGGGTWNTSNAWATSEGGTPATTNYPLAQDTIFFTNTGLLNLTSIAFNFVTNIGSIDSSARTNTVTFTASQSTINVYGDLNLGSGVALSFSDFLNFRSRSIRTLTSSTGVTYGTSTSTISINTVATGGLRLGNNFIFNSGTSANIRLDAGTLDLNNFSLSTGTFSSNSTSARTIAFGTSGKIRPTRSTGTGLSLSYTNLSVTGTSNIERDSTSTVTLDVSLGVSPTAANALNVNIISGASVVTFTGIFGIINFTGSTMNPGNQTIQCAGFVLSTGGTFTSTAFQTNVTGSLTFNGKSISTLAINGSGITTTLNDTPTVTGSTILTLGTLNLNNLTLTTGVLNSSNSNVRSIAFGTTGKIITNTATPSISNIDFGTATNFTFTGNSDITLDMNIARTLTFGTFAGATSANRLNINLLTGGSTITFSGSYRQINFGSTTVDMGTATISCHGFSLSSGGTFSLTTFSIVGTGTLNFNAKTIRNLTIDGSGATTSLSTNGTISTTLTLTNGNLNLNGLTLTTANAATAAGTKSITFNNGTLNISGAGSTAWNNAAPTNFSTSLGTGQGSISMTSASTKTFVGGGSVYNCTLIQGGAGTLTISGNNTFTNITNSVQPCTITFTSSTTTTCTRFQPAGTTGTPVTVTATTATRANINSSQQVLFINCTISNINAQGTSAYRAPASLGNTNGGNNLNISFSNVTSGNGTIFT